MGKKVDRRGRVDSISSDPPMGLLALLLAREHCTPALEMVHGPLICECDCAFARVWGGSEREGYLPLPARQPICSTARQKACLPAGRPAGSPGSSVRYPRSRLLPLFSLDHSGGVGGLYGYGSVWALGRPCCRRYRRLYHQDRLRGGKWAAHKEKTRVRPSMSVDPEASFFSLPVVKGTEGRGQLALELEAGHPPG